MTISEIMTYAFLGTVIALLLWQVLHLRNAVTVMHDNNKEIIDTIMKMNDIIKEQSEVISNYEKWISDAYTEALALGEGL